MLVTLENLALFARDFVSALPRTQGPRAHVVGLKGDLGAGKTTFAQHVARELGVQEPVTSPTYVIAERYSIHHPPFASLVHIDAYRLKPEEVHTIGWEDFIKDPKNLVLVEWPENLGKAFPEDAQVFSFTVESETGRVISHAG